uniref:Tubulin/FtsZ GTPase domain-containing protein n=1 Tax=Panagrolaimus sp. PS1159 TaxID=55785 RepID=A0AC35FX84_9BILA
MPGDIISIQVGQCGNEIGNEFWKRLCTEHCIGMDGYGTTERVYNDNVSTYFSQADDYRFIPRAVLVDLEPRVINSTLNAAFGKLFNLERVFSAGSGAGNNWASGYGAGFNRDSEHGEQILNIIQSEVEISDKIDGFSVSHSIAGGTGSGLGSWILEKLVDEYGHKQIQTFSVFPNSGSDVVVQPYNAILTLQRLIEIPQMVTVLDNEAIEKNAMAKMHIKDPSMKDVNAIIGRIMAGITAPKRFGAPNVVSLFNISAQLCVAPMTPVDPKYIQHTTPTHLMRLLSRSDSMMTRPFYKYSPSQTDCLIAGLALFQGDIDKSEAQNSITKTNSLSPYGSSLIPFFDIQYITSFPQAKNRSAVLALNHSSFEKTLSAILHQFDTMYRNKAYIKNFEKEDYFMDGLEPMVEARNIVEDLIKSYADPWTYCSGGRQENEDE